MKRQAFSLVELLVALALFSLGVLSLVRWGQGLLRLATVQEQLTVRLDREEDRLARRRAFRGPSWQEEEMP